MAARTTNKFKQKPALHFGDLMLPLLGVVALGILIIGVKLLFFPSTAERKPIVVTQPQAVTAQPVAPATTPTDTGDQPASTSGVVATPVTATVVNPQPEPATTKPVQTKPVASSTTTTQPAATVKTPAAPKPPAPKPATQPALSQTVAKSVFLVQSGSFTDEKAANSVVTALKSKGFDASVQRAEVKGRTYFRVNVAGGATREQATAVESKIKALGYPTLVIHR